MILGLRSKPYAFQSPETQSMCKTVLKPQSLSFLTPQFYPADHTLDQHNFNYKFVITSYTTTTLFSVVFHTLLSYSTAQSVCLPVCRPSRHLECTFQTRLPPVLMYYGCAPTHKADLLLMQQ
jgi:hypothetical protein